MDVGDDADAIAEAMAGSPEEFGKAHLLKNFGNPD